MKTKFTHKTRPTQYLVKITARQGDDLWILTNLEKPATIAPMTRVKALRYLTPENGWTRVDEPFTDPTLNEDGTLAPIDEDSCEGCVHRQFVEADARGTSSSGWGCLVSGGHAVKRCEGYSTNIAEAAAK